MDILKNENQELRTAIEILNARIKRLEDQVEFTNGTFQNHIYNRLKLQLKSILHLW